MSWRHSHDSLPDLRQQQQQQQQRRQQDRCRQQLICVAIHIICIVSSLPQFFASRLVDSLNAEFNRTIVVSQLDDQLTTSFEYSVVYYWYTVCLTVLLPVPLLIVLAVVLTASLLRRSRTRHKKVPPVKPGRGTDQDDPSASTSACNCKSLDSLRLHIALIILYLLYLLLLLPPPPPPFPLLFLLVFLVLFLLHHHHHHYHHHHSR